MKVYTKKGDQGETSLIGGTRVLKSSLRIEAYGTVDELNSYIGVVSDAFDHAHSRSILKEVQDRLFTIGSILASAPDSKMIVPDLKDSDVELLEKEMDAMNEGLPELRAFILPGGNIASSYAHLARCVCRRAERIIVDLAQTEDIEALTISYINRLSDYFFVLSRYILHVNNGEEVTWTPRK